MVGKAESTCLSLVRALTRLGRLIGPKERPAIGHPDQTLAAPPSQASHLQPFTINRTMSATDPTLTAQLATLSSVLSALDSTRAALPSLLRSFNQPASSPAERATIYRQHSAQCTSSIQHLASALAAAGPVLATAEASEAANGSTGVVITPRAKQDEGWDRLARVMDGQVADCKGKGKARAVEYDNGVLSPGGPTDRDQLKAEVDDWAARNRRLGKVEVDVRGEQVRFEVRGVMRVVVMVRWTKAGAKGDGGVDADGEAEPARCQVERVACFGLKEDVSTLHFSSESHRFPAC